MQHFLPARKPIYRNVQIAIGALQAWSQNRTLRNFAVDDAAEIDGWARVGLAQALRHEQLLLDYNRELDFKQLCDVLTFTSTIPPAPTSNLDREPQAVLLAVSAT